MELIKTSLRWIAVIPASVVASLLVYALIRLGDALFAMLWGLHGYQNFFLDAIAHVAFGFSFVSAGAYVAPKFKPKVAIFLGVIAVLFIASMALLSTTTYDVFWKSLSFWKELFYNIATIAGSIYAIRTMSDEIRYSLLPKSKPKSKPMHYSYWKE